MRVSRADGWKLDGDDAFPCVIASTAIIHTSEVISQPAADTYGRRLLRGPSHPYPWRQYLIARIQIDWIQK